MWMMNARASQGRESESIAEVLMKNLLSAAIFLITAPVIVLVTSLVKPSGSPRCAGQEFGRVDGELP
jgi:hypothetical protein